MTDAERIADLEAKLAEQKKSSDRRLAEAYRGVARRTEEIREMRQQQGTLRQEILLLEEEVQTLREERDEAVSKLGNERRVDELAPSAPAQQPQRSSDFTR